MYIKAAKKTLAAVLAAVLTLGCLPLLLAPVTVAAATAYQPYLSKVKVQAESLVVLDLYWDKDVDQYNAKQSLNGKLGSLTDQYTTMKGARTKDHFFGDAVFLDEVIQGLINRDSPEKVYFLSASTYWSGHSDYRIDYTKAQWDRDVARTALELGMYPIDPANINYVQLGPKSANYNKLYPALYYLIENYAGKGVFDGYVKIYGEKDMMPNPSVWPPLGNQQLNKRSSGSINLAMMICAHENAIPLSQSMIDWITDEFVTKNSSGDAVKAAVQTLLANKIFDTTLPYDITDTNNLYNTGNTDFTAAKAANGGSNIFDFMGTGTSNSIRDTTLLNFHFAYDLFAPENNPNTAKDYCAKFSYNDWGNSGMPFEYGPIDYFIATKAFIINLNAENSTQERDTEAKILKTANYAQGTPVIGGMQGEGAELNTILNAGYTMSFFDAHNASVTSSFPSDPALLETHKPAVPATIDPNGAYVAFYVTDGDSFMCSAFLQEACYENAVVDRKSAGEYDYQNSTAIPIGWSVPPMMFDVDPSLLIWRSKNSFGGKYDFVGNYSDGSAPSGPSDAGANGYVDRYNYYINNLVGVSGNKLISTINYFDDNTVGEQRVQRIDPPSGAIFGYQGNQGGDRTAFRTFDYGNMARTRLSGQTQGYADNGANIATSARTALTQYALGTPAFAMVCAGDGAHSGDVPKNVTDASKIIKADSSLAGRAVYFVTPSELLEIYKKWYNEDFSHGQLVDDTSGAIQYDNWGSWSESGLYGGSAHYTNTNRAATLEYTFQGTGIQWITKTDPNQGQAEVFIDGASKGIVNLSRTRVDFMRPVFETRGLPNASHTIKIVAQAPLNRGLSIDAFRVLTEPGYDFSEVELGYLIHPHDANTHGVVFSLTSPNGNFTGGSGTWTENGLIAPDKGAGRVGDGYAWYTYTTGSNVGFQMTFKGTGFQWITKSNAAGNSSLANVYLNGTLVGENIELSRPTTIMQMVAFEMKDLPYAEYTLRIVPVTLSHTISFNALRLFTHVTWDAAGAAASSRASDAWGGPEQLIDKVVSRTNGWISKFNDKVNLPYAVIDYGKPQRFSWFEVYPMHSADQSDVETYQSEWINFKIEGSVNGDFSNGDCDLLAEQGPLARLAPCMRFVSANEDKAYRYIRISKTAFDNGDPWNGPFFSVSEFVGMFNMEKYTALGDGYTITATAGPNGGISPSGGVTVSAGANQLFTFTPDAGFAIDEVKVDGVPVSITGNTYEFMNVAGNHTISVTFRNPLGYIMIDDKDPSVIYTKYNGGRWDQDPLNYNGTLWYSGGGDLANSLDKVTLTFTGTGVEYISQKAAKGGMVNVYIDNALDAVNVDTYNPTVLYQQVLYKKTGLHNGTHTIRIEQQLYANAHNPLNTSNRNEITCDAFKVYTGGPQTPAAPGEVTGLAITHTGFSFTPVAGIEYTVDNWATSNTSGVFSGLKENTQYILKSRAAGDVNLETVQSVTTRPTPTGSYTITATAGPGGGISPSGGVTVSAGANQLFTFTPSSAEYVIQEVKVDGVPVSITGNTYEFIYVTANHTIDVTFSDGSYLVDDKGNIAVTHNGPGGGDNSGRWDQDPANYMGTLWYSGGGDLPNSLNIVTFSFTGTGVEWIGQLTPDGGKANIKIDGVLDGVFVDVYNPTYAPQSVLYKKTGLPYGSHTITIEQLAAEFRNPLNTAAGSSGGPKSALTIDAFRVYTRGPQAPAAPAPIGSFDLTVNTAIGFTPAAGVDYTIDNWATTNNSGSFTGLAPDTVYIIKSRAEGGVNLETVQAVKTALTSVVFYTINAAAGAGGSISPSGDVSVVQGGEQVFVITADSGYTIDSVSVDGVPEPVPQYTYTFANVTADHTIAVTFKAKGTLTCGVKSMLAKIGKPLAIPVDWNGAGGVGALTFTSSNPAVCTVSNGILSPLKAGVAVITITAPNGDKVVFAVTVTA